MESSVVPRTSRGRQRDHLSLNRGDQLGKAIESDVERIASPPLNLEHEPH